jgi:hypothetical protein
MFVTYNSDDKPYPFGPWPGSEDTAIKAPAKKKATKKATTEKTNNN